MPLTPPMSRRPAVRIPSTASSRLCPAAQALSMALRDPRSESTCTTRRRACTRSCAPITITRARTGPGTRPYPLALMDRGRIAKLPTYYVMDLAKGMAATVAEESRRQRRSPRQMADRERAGRLRAEYARTGFQGGLQWYRCGTQARQCRSCTHFGPHHRRALRFHRGQAGLGRLSVPRRLRQDADQGLHQHGGSHLLDGAGHWVQQEQPAEVSRLLVSIPARGEAARRETARGEGNNQGELTN